MQRVLDELEKKCTEEALQDLHGYLSREQDIKQYTEDVHTAWVLLVNYAVEYLPSLGDPKTLQIIRYISSCLYFILQMNIFQLGDQEKEQFWKLISNSLHRIFKGKEKLENLKESIHISSILMNIVIELCKFSKEVPETILRDLVDIIKCILIQKIEYTSEHLRKKIILNCVMMLKSLTKITKVKKLLWSTSFCTTLFPISALSPCHSLELVPKNCCIYKDSGSFVDILSYTDNFTERCDALLSILDSSSSFLSQADDKILESRFIGFSQQLGVAIFQLHAAILRLMHILNKEFIDIEKNISLVNVLNQLLKNTPYRTLSLNYQSCIFSSITSLLYKIDKEIINLDSQQLIPKLLHCLSILLSNSSNTELELMLKSEKGKYLMEYLLSSLFDSKMLPEVMNVIQILFKNYSSVPLDSRYYPKLENWILHSLDTWIFSSSKQSTETFFQLLLSFITVNQNMELWKQSFEKCLQELTENTSSPTHIQSSILHFFGITDSEYYKELNENSISELSTFLLMRSSKNKNPSIQCSTLEALIPLCKEGNELFLLQACRCMVDTLISNRSNLQRIKTMKVLCEFLPCLNSSLENKDWINLLSKLFDTSNLILKRSLPEKLTTIRLLGRLGKHSPISFLYHESETRKNCIISSLINLLVEQLGFEQHVKIQWNSCVSLGFILENDDIYSQEVIPTIEKAVIHLANLTWNSTNYKLRIHAAHSLCCTSSVKCFGNSLETVISSIRLAEENSTIPSSEGNNTFHSQRKLQQTIQTTMNHLKSLQNEI